MTKNTSTRIREENWVKFYNSLTNIREKKEVKDGFTVIDINEMDEYFNKLLEKMLRLGDKIGNKEDYFSIFMQGKDKKFDHENYFSLIWLVRLLNTEQRENIASVMGKKPEEGWFRVDKKGFQLYLNKRSRLENWDKKKPLPDFVIKFWRWWFNTGNDIDESYIGNMDGFGNELIHDPKIPNLIKIHILSRFIMKRNHAMKGPKNFEINSEIVNDSRNAVSLGENFLRRESNNSSENTGNRFFSANGVKCLFEIEKLLLIVRSEKDINHIIKEASNTLGTALTVENRVWSAITCYWCNHILWRCSVCKGDIKIAEMFETTCEKIIDDYLPNVSDLQLRLSGGYQDEMRFENYKKGIAHQHWDMIKIIATKEKKVKYQKPVTQKYYNGLIREVAGKDDPDNKKLKALKEEKVRITKEKNNLKYGQSERTKKEYEELDLKIIDRQKKIDKILGDDIKDLLSENRIKFYTNYIGLDEEKLKIKINDERDLGRPKLLFSTQDRDRSRVKKLEGEELEEFLSSKKPHTIWEEKIQFIPDFLKETLNYLKESPSIVSIPTARLVIFDILLLFSRISESINPELNKSNKKLEKDDVKEIERIWEIVKQSLKDINNTLRWIENYFEIITGKGKLNDLEKIIKRIEKIHKGEKGSKKSFGIKTEKKESQIIEEEKEINNSYSAGESIKELLNELIGTDKVELYFPIKS